MLINFIFKKCSTTFYICVFPLLLIILWQTHITFTAFSIESHNNLVSVNYVNCVCFFFSLLSPCVDEFCCFCHRFYPRLSSKWLSRQKGNDPMSRWVTPALMLLPRLFTGPTPVSLTTVWNQFPFEENYE